MMRNLLLCVGIAFACSTFAQDILFETFDSDADFTTSIPQFTDNNFDFFTNTLNNSFSANYVVGLTGNYFAAQDIDGEGELPQQELIWSGLDITGVTDIDFMIDVSEDDANDNNDDWDAADFFHVDYSIDGGAFQPLIWIENDGSSTNSAPFLDTDFDGTGDGTEITDALVALSQSISGLSGMTLDLKITMSLNSGDEDIAFDNVRLVDATPLPVSLTSFTATPVGSKVMLDWATASEINNSHFAIEMSRDAADFQEKGIVNGQGTTESLATYNYEFSNLTEGTYYFRLRQVDFDGQFSYSDVATVEISGANNNDIKIYGNRVANDLSFDLEKAGNIRIHSQTGALVAEYNLAEGYHTIDVSNLPSGVFVITNGQTTKRFVK